MLKMLKIISLYFKLFYVAKKKYLRLSGNSL